LYNKPNKEGAMKVTIENLESRVIRKAEYFLSEIDIDGDSREMSYGTLSVEFTNGRTYDYDDVTVETFTKLVASASLGKFLNQEIKPYHKAREILPIA
jgi:hypothetical protein